uniref:Uncharacterized protein n=1 Tax=Leersia perrieri TaxID=77586 RepID=A0A0D9V0Y8_9ORYZ
MAKNKSSAIEEGTAKRPRQEEATAADGGPVTRDAPTIVPTAPAPQTETTLVVEKTGGASSSEAALSTSATPLSLSASSKGGAILVRHRLLPVGPGSHAT